MHRNLQTLLARFAAVREAGPGRWRCKRPGSSEFNVRVAIGENGGVLLHDHAGRSPAEVLAELGMTLADLAPEREELHRVQSPAERREARRSLALASVESAARVLDSNANVLQAAAAMLAEGQRLDAEDRDRLSAAHDAIVAARMMLRAEVRP